MVYKYNGLEYGKANFEVLKHQEVETNQSTVKREQYFAHQRNLLRYSNKGELKRFHLSQKCNAEHLRLQLR